MRRKISLVTLATLFMLTGFITSSYAKYPKPQLGAYLRELDDVLREKLNYHDQGVLVQDVVKESGAEKAGLAKNDIILEFNRHKVSSIQDLVNAVSQTTPGDTVPVKFFRNGAIKITPVEITEKKDWIRLTPPQKWVRFGSDRPYLGVRIQELNSQLAEYFMVKSGILITAVTEDSPAHKADLRAGDVITAWQDKDVEDSREFYRHLGNSKEGDKINLNIVRHDKRMTKEVILGARKDHETYGFHINRDDTGDVVFRMGNKEYPAHLDIPLPQADLDLKDLKDSLKSLKEGIGSYHEEIKKLREEIQELKNEIRSLREKKNI